MDTGRADVVVVGGGAMGSAAAWQLAVRGVDVILIEQFQLGHTRGSSHGSSRIVRLSYADPFYVDLAVAAYQQWDQLETETGEQLLTWTGVVDHGEPQAVAALRTALQGRGQELELLDAAHAAERWPGLRFEGPVLYHSRGGRVHADRTVAALQRAAAARGADIRHGLRVEEVLPRADGVEVRTADGWVQAPAAVVAAGAWTSTLLAGLVPLPRFTVTQEQPAHFPSLDPATSWPSFIHHLSEAQTRGAATPRGAYGLGSPDGVKVGMHAVGPVVDPDRAGAAVDHDQLRRLQDYVGVWVPGVDVNRPAAAPCLYTLTDNADFVVDRVGPLTVAAGFSGHGFKFTPQIGRLVADLVLDGAGGPRRFRLNRA